MFTIIYFRSYALLGLATSLDPSGHGGTEKILVPSAKAQLVTPTIAPCLSASETDVPRGFGRIVRDAAGHVTCVEINETEPQAEVDVEDIDNVDLRIDPDVRRQWASEFTKGTIGVTSDESVINGKPHVHFSLHPHFKSTLFLT